MKTMTSLDFLNNIINPARVAAGESAVQNNQFVKRVADELDLLETQKLFELGKTGHKMPYFDLTEDQMRLVGMRESKAVRKIEDELDDLGVKQKICLTPKGGRPAEYYDLTMTLVTGYSVKDRLAVVKRWLHCTPFDFEGVNFSPYHLSE
ncbi:TPA: hypothetical protein ACSP88_002531 [Aeromonas hydrophila]